MKNLIKIKHYPSNFEIAYEENNETIVHSLSYDGLKGELTIKEWEKDCFIADFDEIDQEKILDYMNIYEIFADKEELSLGEIADIEELEYVETTSGTNGYPQNIQGAIIGFEDWEQLEKIAIKYNLEAINLHRRDGWQLYERQGNASEPYKNSSSDYGDDYCEYDDADAYQEQIMEDILPYAEFTTFEDVGNWLKEKKEVYDELLTCGENEIVITYQGRFYEKIEEASMSSSHDTHHYIIGLQECGI
ncbi:MAG: hypothetical protein PHO12_04855 [Bacteroidales bacterium]|nr:hypothetical protein [Bacteroidales bacterium]MDD4685141.1 hypothetical protein [Bacteroidales bacterium]